MCRFLLILLVVSAVTSGGVGDDVDIKSPVAQAAIAKCDNAIADAEKVAKDAETQALNDLAAALEKAKVVAMKAGDLPEAIALDRKIKETKERIEKLNAPVVKPVQFEVYGDRGWQILGRVVTGQHLRIIAHGQWTDNVGKPELMCGPDGIGGGRFRLIAQINGHNSFTVGSDLDLVVPETGDIEFGMSDSGHVNGGGKLVITMRLVQ